MYGHTEDFAWYRDNSEGAAKPVGQKRPNGWGVHDMLGNVWEWCSDVYDPNVYGTYKGLSRRRLGRRRSGLPYDKPQVQPPLV